MTTAQTTSASYEVGYRKPPRHTQFQKGQSGNPGGRPRRSQEPTAPTHAVSAPQPETAAAAPAGRTPSLPPASESRRRRGVLPRRNEPGRRRRSPAVNTGKVRGERSGGLRRSPGRTKSGPGPAQAAGGHAHASAAPAERGKKLKIPC